MRSDRIHCYVNRHTQYAVMFSNRFSEMKVIVKHYGVHEFVASALLYIYLKVDTNYCYFRESREVFFPEVLVFCVQSGVFVVVTEI